MTISFPLQRAYTARETTINKYSVWVTCSHKVRKKLADVCFFFFTSAESDWNTDRTRLNVPVDCLFCCYEAIVSFYQKQRRATTERFFLIPLDWDFFIMFSFHRCEWAWECGAEFLYNMKICSLSSRNENVRVWAEQSMAKMGVASRRRNENEGRVTNHSCILQLRHFHAELFGVQQDAKSFLCYFYRFFFCNFLHGFLL